VGGVIGVLKGMSEMNDRSPSYERFVEHCLQKEGYEVIGWKLEPTPRCTAYGARMLYGNRSQYVHDSYVGG
jgi:hypothetical protein